MAKDYVEILKIKEEEESEIKKNSPASLPLNPTAQGWSGSEIRKKLSHSIIGEKGSVLSLLGDRIEKTATILNEFDTQVKANADDIALKVNTSDIVDDLVSTDTDKPLSANQGKVLNDKKVDKITEAQRDSLGFIEPNDRIVYGSDINLNEMPIKATTFKRKNTIVMRDWEGVFQDLYDHNSGPGAHPDEFNKKVDKTQTIIGLDLQDNILLGEFRTALGNATQSVAGLLSAEDKTHLDGLVALLETSDSNDVVDTIGEILAIFQNYPEGAELVTVLQGKVDKVAGKGLSTNDFTDTLKNKLETLETSKQDKLVAGDNITIDENTNVISASGGEVDLNSMAYFNYAGSIYGDKYSLFLDAWEHSLTVDPEEISEDSSYLNPAGKAQYPDGETEGVVIPQGITRIGDYTFYGWSSNNQPLVIPNSVTNIGNRTFASWSSNNQPLVIPNSVTSIGEGAFNGWLSNNKPLVIPNSVTSIGEGAFFNWISNNQPIIIPNSVTSIGELAFNGWSLVPYVEIQAITPPTLSKINAFGDQNDAPIYVPDESVDDYKTATNWVNLADRIFPISDMISDSVLSDRIDNLETSKQDKLVAGTNITIDENTNVISAEVDLDEMSYFNYASRIYGDRYSLLTSAWEHSLTVDPLEISVDSDEMNFRGIAQYPNGETYGVIIPQGVTSIGSFAFSYWSSNNQPLVIPNSVTNIGMYAFFDWLSNNQPLVIPNSVTNIRNSAFDNWRVNDKQLVIPNSVTSIGGGAFDSWSSNNQPLVIPNSVTSIGGRAFYNWSLVPYVEMKATTPPSLAHINAFAEQNDAPIYVPDESVDDYKTATNWVDLASRIFPISDKDNTYTNDEIDLMIGDIEGALDAILGV